MSYRCVVQDSDTRAAIVFLDASEGMADQCWLFVSPFDRCLMRFASSCRDGAPSAGAAASRTEPQIVVTAVAAQLVPVQSRQARATSRRNPTITHCCRPHLPTTPATSPQRPQYTNPSVKYHQHDGKVGHHCHSHRSSLRAARLLRATLHLYARRRGAHATPS